MSQRADGTHRCDRCGLDVGNGDIVTATKAVTLEQADAGDGMTIPTPVALEFCTAPREDFPRGCTGRVLSDANLADYRRSKESTP